MFDNPILERLSRVHPIVPPLIYLPVIVVPAGAARSDAQDLAGRRRSSACSSLGLVVLVADRVPAAPLRLPPRARQRVGPAAALHHPRRSPRLPARPDAARDAARRSASRSRSSFFFGFRARARARVVAARVRGLPARLPDLRHERTTTSTITARRTGSAWRCAATTTATTSSSPTAASASPRRSGTACSARSPASSRRAAPPASA